MNWKNDWSIKSMTKWISTRVTHHLNKWLTNGVTNTLTIKVTNWSYKQKAKSILTDWPTDKQTDWLDNRQTHRLAHWSYDLKKIDWFANWTMNQLRDLLYLKLNNLPTDWPLNYSFKTRLTDQQIDWAINGLTDKVTNW